MYAAKPPKFRSVTAVWTVELEIMCCNGLKAWFVICYVDEASDLELGYSDGAILSAKERAELIAKALNSGISK